jgi:hypothetical protein
VALVVLLCGAGGVVAAATTAAAAPRPRTAAVAKCSGTFAKPGLLAGTYNGTVDVSGVCFQDGPPAIVEGNLVLTPGSALNATFALDDMSPSGGRTSLTVTGNVELESGATLFLGCEPNFAACSDSSSLAGRETILGSVTATDALGIVMHATYVKGSVTESGGGGGVSCTPTGVFAMISSPVYSDYEDVTIGGSLEVTGMRTCWLGSLRNAVYGNLTDSNNVMADPDAGEVLANVVHGNLACASNSPRVHYGDSGSSPNTVYGSASGECGFDVTAADPKYYFGGLVPSPNEGRKEAEVLPISTRHDPFVAMAGTTDGRGYWLADGSGSVFTFGDAVNHGSQAAGLPFPVAGFAPTHDGGGYWLATSDGRVLHFGDAASIGPARPLAPGYPIVAVASTPDGQGYWLATANGGVYPYGDARSYGSEAGHRIAAGIVGFAPAPDGKGYWLVANDGGVFGFGDAHFFGSEGGRHLNAPIVGMAAGPAGRGYWLVASDGGIFTFGSARFHGSEGGHHLNNPVAGMQPTPGGKGYWLVAGDGGVFGFGNAHFYGSKG